MLFHPVIQKEREREREREREDERETEEERERERILEAEKLHVPKARVHLARLRRRVVQPRRVLVEWRD